jgi:hypothetical protein
LLNRLDSKGDAKKREASPGFVESTRFKGRCEEEGSFTRALLNRLDSKGDAKKREASPGFVESTRFKGRCEEEGSFTRALLNRLDSKRIIYFCLSTKLNLI